MFGRYQGASPSPFARTEIGFDDSDGASGARRQRRAEFRRQPLVADGCEVNLPFTPSVLNESRPQAQYAYGDPLNANSREEGRHV